MRFSILHVQWASIIVIIGDYDNAKTFYRSHNKLIRQYPESFFGYVYEKLLKKCIGTSSGKDWIENEKTTNTIFHNEIC